MLKIGMDLPKSRYAYTLEEALEAAKEIGFPLIIRASYTLAGGEVVLLIILMNLRP